MDETIAAADPPGGQADGKARDQQRHQADVDDLERCRQPFDVAVQAVLNIAKLFTGGQGLGSKAFDRRPFFGGQHGGTARLGLFLQVGNLPLDLFQFLSQV